MRPIDDENVDHNDNDENTVPTSADTKELDLHVSCPTEYRCRAAQGRCTPLTGYTEPRPHPLYRSLRRPIAFCESVIGCASVRYNSSLPFPLDQDTPELYENVPTWPNKSKL